MFDLYAWKITSIIGYQISYQYMFCWLINKYAGEAFTFL